MRKMMASVLFTVLDFRRKILNYYRVCTRWSKREANLEHTSCLCIFNNFASCLLHHVNTPLRWPAARHKKI